MKLLVKIAIVSAVFASCGTQNDSSDVNSTLPVLGASQEISNVKISCVDSMNSRDLKITANAVFENSMDSLHLKLDDQGAVSNTEFALNERSGGLSIEKSLSKMSDVISLELYTKGSNELTTHVVEVDLNETCTSEDALSQNFLDDLSDSINEASSEHKPSQDFCKFGIQIGIACIAPQFAKKLEK